MNRIALIGIIVEESSAAVRINELLHEYRDHIIGRMGLPHAGGKDMSVISVVMDAPGDVINAVSGKLGRINGVSTKTVYPKSSVKKEGES